MILAVPVLMPVTMPVEPTVATAILLLLHMPPGTEPVNVVVDPMQTKPLPVIVGVA